MKMTKEQAFKRDQLIISFIREHKGLKNAVSAAELQNYLFKCLGVPQKSIAEKIRKIIINYNLPICSTNGKGYYWPVTSEDILHTVNDLKKRMNFMAKHIELLESFIVK